MSRIAYLVLAAAVFALAGSGAGASVRTLSHDEPGVTHGVVVGDVTARTAVVWARADREGTLKVHLSGGKHRGVARLDVHAADDYTGQVVLTGLRPDTTYRYRVGSERGSFETAPAADDSEAVRLVFGGDVAGQNVCRDTREGFPIFETIRAERPDVFVGLGDMIYADNGWCPGPARRRTWRPSGRTGGTTGPMPPLGGCSRARATWASGTTTRS